MSASTAVSSTAAVIDEACSIHAREIYARLLVHSAEISATGVKLKADANSLALLSLKLAQSFQAAERAVNAESLPKNQDFKVDISDIAGWSTK